MKPPIPNYIMNTETAPAGRSWFLPVVVVIVLIVVGYFIYKDRNNDKEAIR